MKIRLLLAFLFVTCTAGLLAHPNLQNAMWVQFEPKLVRVAVNVSLKELTVASGLVLPEGGAPEAAALAGADRHKDYLLEHLRLSVGADALPGSVLKVTPPEYFTDPEQTLFQYELEYPYCGKMPTEVVFFHDMLREWSYSENVPWDLSYLVRSKSMGSGEVQSWLLRTRQPSPLPTGLGELAAAGPVPAESPEEGVPRGAALLERLLPLLDPFQKGAVRVLTQPEHWLFIGLVLLALCSQWQLGLVVFVLTAGGALAALCLGVESLSWLKPWGGVVAALCSVLFALGNLQARGRSLLMTRFALVAVFGFATGLRLMEDVWPPGVSLGEVEDWGSFAAYLIGVAGAYEAVLLPGFFLLEALRRREMVLARPLALRFASGLLGLAGVCSLALNLRR
jgi:hypothetical protein